MNEGGYGGLTDDELWHWHAYDYAWRRVFLTARQDKSPADPTGRWFNATLADHAEAALREAQPKRHRPPREMVREDFERLPVRDWTAAELALRLREVDDIVRDNGYEPGPIGRKRVALDMIAAARKRAKKAFNEPEYPTYQPTAQEIAPPPGFESASLTPERLRELMGRLG